MHWHWQGHPSHKTQGDVAQVSHLTAAVALLITATYDGVMQFLEMYINSGF